MTLLADLLSTVFDRHYRRPTHQGRDPRPLNELVSNLIGSAGETSGLALAQDIVSAFENLDDAGKLEFFRHIATGINISSEAVRSTLNAYEKASSKATYRTFMSAVEPRRQELIRRLNSVPGSLVHWFK